MPEKQEEADLAAVAISDLRATIVAARVCRSAICGRERNRKGADLGEVSSETDARESSDGARVAAGQKWKRAPEGVACRAGQCADLEVASPMKEEGMLLSSHSGRFAAIADSQRRARHNGLAGGDLMLAAQEAATLMKAESTGVQTDQQQQWKEQIKRLAPADSNLALEEAELEEVKVTSVVWSLI